MLLDNGGDLTHYAQKNCPKMFAHLKGIVEESMTGIHRLYQMSRSNLLVAPAMNLSDSIVKSKFDALYLSKETLVEALKRCTDIMLGGKQALVCGYGEVGKGCCQALRGAGCQVLVSEIDPICALQACMEGYRVVKMDDVLKQIDLVITATGNTSVLTREHAEKLKSGAIVANMGHSHAEIDAQSLEQTDIEWNEVRENVHHLTFPKYSPFFINLIYINLSFFGATIYSCLLT